MEKLSHLVLCCAKLATDSMRPYGLYNPPGSSILSSPGKNTGVGCHGLLQEMFQTQGSNPCLLHLLHWQAVLYH